MLPLNPWTVAMIPSDRAWLGDFFESWQLLADLSFSDLVCWVPDQDGSTMFAVAQIRPATGPTALPHDVVGEQLTDVDSPIAVAYRTQRTVELLHAARSADSTAIPIDVSAIPVLREGRRIAVVSRHTNRLAIRSQGLLEQFYAESAAVLEEMLGQARFPLSADDPEPSHSPNVGDGIIRVDAEGVVTYASPNAQTSFRHLGLAGQFEGEPFRALVYELIHDREPIDQVRIDVLHDRLVDARVFDLHNDIATVRVRIVPLQTSSYAGALILARDISDIRARERQLVTKDATIREIHHRVKNNLQTVSALLRMQSRRIGSLEAKGALAKAQQRIAAIGVVHELLSQSHDDVVDFDPICDKLLTMTAHIVPADGKVQVVRTGSFGQISGDAATPLCLILNELCHNAVEHGLGLAGGRVEVAVERTAMSVGIDVINHSTRQSHPAESLTSSSGLGLNIVATLVDDLGGAFELTLTPTGAVAHVDVPTARISLRT